MGWGARGHGLLCLCKVPKCTDNSSGCFEPVLQNGILLQRGYLEGEEWEEGQAWGGGREGGREGEEGLVVNLPPGIVVAAGGPIGVWEEYGGGWGSSKGCQRGGGVWC